MLLTQVIYFVTCLYLCLAVVSLLHCALLTDGKKYAELIE